jgi:hypothetical protein
MLLSITKILSEIPLLLTILSIFLQLILCDSRFSYVSLQTRPTFLGHLSQLPCKEIIFTWRHIIPRSLTIFFTLVELPYFLFFVHKRHDFRKNVSDNMGIFFSTVIWSILNPRKIRWGCYKILLVFMRSYYYIWTKSERGRRVTKSPPL